MKLCNSSAKMMSQLMRVHDLILNHIKGFQLITINQILKSC